MFPGGCLLDLQGPRNERGVAGGNFGGLVSGSSGTGVAARPGSAHVPDPAWPGLAGKSPASAFGAPVLGQDVQLRNPR